MSRRIRVRGEQREELDLNRLAHALLQATRARRIPDRGDPDEEGDLGPDEEGDLGPLPGDDRP